MTNQADIDVKIDCQPVRGVPPLSGAVTTGESEQAAVAVHSLFSV